MKTNTLLAAVFSFGICATAHATFLTSNSLIGTTVVDFSQQPTVSHVSGPIQVGMPVGLNILAKAGTPNTYLSTNVDAWPLLEHGDWGGGRTYISAWDDTYHYPGWPFYDQASLIVQFVSGPVSAVGGFMNYAVPNSASDHFALDLIIRAYDASFAVLESYNVTALADIYRDDYALYLNLGAFRGIQRATADISFFEVFGTGLVLDDLTFVPAANQVSEPAMLGLLGLGLIGMAIQRRHLKWARRRSHDQSV